MKKFVHTLLAVLGLCSSCSKKDIASKTEFTSEFAQALRKASPGTKFEIVHDLELKITNSGDQEFTAFLDNAYDQYKHFPETRSDIIQKYVASTIDTIVASNTSEVLDRSRIVPIIKDKPWMEEVRETMAGRGTKKMPENVYEELNPDLVVIYAEDSPKNIRYITPKDLEKAHIDRKELRALACENLKRIIPKIERQGANGIYMLTAGGDYEASLLLFDSIWTDLEKDVHGEIVVAIPTRDLLLATGSEDRDGLEKLKGLVNQASSQAAYKISSKLFVRRNATFVEFSPPK